MKIKRIDEYAWAVRHDGQDYQVTVEWGVGSGHVSRTYSAYKGDSPSHGKLLGDHDHGRLDDALDLIEHGKDACEDKMCGEKRHTAVRRLIDAGIPRDSAKGLVADLPLADIAELTASMERAMAGKE